MSDVEKRLASVERSIETLEKGLVELRESAKRILEALKGDEIHA